MRSLCKHLYTHLLVSFDRNLGNLKFYLLLKLLISMVIYLRWSAFLKFEFAREDYYKSFPDAESWLFIDSAADMYIKALIWKNLFVKRLSFSQVDNVSFFFFETQIEFYLLVWHVLVCPVNDSLNL